jgi:hypothetical protein
MQLERELPLRAYFCGQKNDMEKAHAPSPVSVKVGERSKDGGGHVIEGGESHLLFPNREGKTLDHLSRHVEALGTKLPRTATETITWTDHLVLLYTHA